MKSPRIALVLLALAGVLIAAGCGSSESVPKDAVAVVDGEAISRADLDALLARAKKSYEQQKRDFPKAGTPEYQSLQTQAVAYLVQREEYDQRAAELDVEVTDAELDKRVAEVKKQYFGDDEKKFQAQLKQQGYTQEAFREDLRAQLVSEKLYEKVTGDVKVTAAEVEAYYAKNKQQYVVPESREVRHILVKTKAEADTLYDQLKGGADFAQLAKQKSLDPGSKNSGGKLTISRGQTVEAFDKTAFLLGKNVLSRPVKTEYGFHLIEPLSAIKPGKTTPLKQVEATIRRQLLDEKRNAKITSWANGVREDFDGKVKYAEGLEPPEQQATETDGGAGTGAPEETGEG